MIKKSNINDKRKQFECNKLLMNIMKNNAELK